MDEKLMGHEKLMEDLLRESDLLLIDATFMTHEEKLILLKKLQELRKEFNTKGKK